MNETPNLNPEPGTFFVSLNFAVSGATSPQDAVQQFAEWVAGIDMTDVGVSVSDEVGFIGYYAVQAL